jgi:hypothetical protein
VTEKYVCPCCGYLLDVPRQAENSGLAEGAVQAVIESMGREIRQLRETVAMLRGARAG